MIALADGKPAVVEYSEISREMAEASDASGRLLYGAAHICVNYFSLPYLRRFCEHELATHKKAFLQAVSGERTGPWLQRLCR